ncbi:helicase-exonuclease AddAB subunit AddA [Thermolongibacillus altinsuensis]
MKKTLPPKPAGSQWTDAQWKAIVTSGAHTLVAAAAGSGKTAVLVERIIQKLLDEQQPIDVDRLLVVTFTNAAAAEMRQRIGEALEKALEAEPHSLHLRRQLSLLQKASISTIHSFCLDVIRKYYYLIDLDPVFRIADETEIALLKEEVIEELFEDYYGKADNEAFLDVVDRYTSDRTDADLQTIVLRLYEFSRSHPNPNEWLSQLVEMYDLADDVTIDQLPYVSYLFQYIDFSLQAAEEMLKQAIEKTKQPNGPDYLRETLEQDLINIQQLKEARHVSWQRLYETFQSLAWVTAKRKPKGEEYDESLVDEVKKLRDKAKEKIKSVKEELFSFKPETWLRHLREMKPVVATIVELVQQFAERLQAKKAEKGIVDFSDLEHYCLQILRDPSSTVDRLIPSDAALDYRAQFVEVLVDEYQDVNMVQEAILRLVTNDEEATGNLFMVGDVKQSIYGFRLAEPSLFLSKYQRFTTDEKDGGVRIDLAQNFRSRREILDGTNFIFKQIMGETVGQIAYDDDAALRFGATYYPEKEQPIECIWIDRADHGAENESEGQAENEEQELENAQLEARFIAKKIKQLIDEPFYVYDRHLQKERRIMYRDIVILLRSMPWASQMMEEFRKQGIPVYAELSSGYFSATEVSVMLSLLKLIDNPYQDIPLAAVLRSPIVGLDENELARIRLEKKDGSFYEALTMFLTKVPTEEEKELHEKLSTFIKQLEAWRTKARQGSLADLIWQLYRDTNFYDFVGGMPGGKQRQANLRALYDRARQFEKTAFRGIFRFLRFIERMQQREDDLGAARALSEQEDVVRIMTIHKSKGLEFPVVFVAGIGKSFNTQDLRQNYLMDKELGFAARYVHPKLRVSYPTIAQLALKRKLALHSLAEEMRILYVALTRAKEKLYLIATVKDLEKEKQRWQAAYSWDHWLLPDYILASANSYLDWIGHALIRHRQSEALQPTMARSLPEEIVNHPAKWKIEVVSAAHIEEKEREEAERNEALIEAVRKLEPISIESEYSEEVARRMKWTYEHEIATVSRAKQSVSELKRQREIFGADGDLALLRPFRTEIIERPRFMQAKKLTPAEKGTVMHLVMQHVDLKSEITEESIREQVAKMVHGEWLTEEQAKEVDVASIVAFFQTDIGQRLRRAPRVEREVPFSLALSAQETYGHWTAEAEEAVLVQGVFDCLFEDENGLVLIDFKTDHVRWMDNVQAVLERRYRVQMELYRRAVEQIWKKRIDESYVYVFDCAQLFPM